MTNCPFYTGLIITTLIILAVPGFTNESIKNNKASITGKVLFEGEGLSFATVNVKSSTFGTSTDADGNFVLMNLPANGSG